MISISPRFGVIFIWLIPRSLVARFRRGIVALIRIGGLFPERLGSLVRYIRSRSFVAVCAHWLEPLALDYLVGIGRCFAGHRYRVHATTKPGLFRRRYRGGSF